jgi:hypothetical protein
VAVFKHVCLIELIVKLCERFLNQILILKVLSTHVQSAQFYLRFPIQESLPTNALVEVLETKGHLLRVELTASFVEETVLGVLE